MKKMVSMLLAAFLILGLAACGRAPESTTGGASDGQAAGADKGSSDTVSLRLSTHVSEINGSGWLVKTFAEHVKEISGGAMEIDAYFDGQLGSQTEACEALIANTIDMTMIDSGTLANYDPRIGILDMPYVFESKDQCIAALDAGLEETLSTWVTETCGIRPISLQCTLFRNCFVSGKKIQTVDDFKGIKMRIPDNPSMKICFTALGATPVAMPSGEAYTAIQTGVADAVEGPFDFVYESKFYEVADTCSLTEHVLCCTALCISDASWKKLTEEQQGWLNEAVRVTRAEYYPMYVELEEARRSELEAQGVAFVTSDKSGMMDACAPALESYIKDNQMEEIYQLILSCA